MFVVRIDYWEREIFLHFQMMLKMLNSYRHPLLQTKHETGSRLKKETEVEIFATCELRYFHCDRYRIKIFLLLQV